MAQRKQQHRELETAFLIIIVLSGVYVAYDILAEPAGSHPFGHMLGIIGTLLMVMTETLYSLRKRTTLLNWAGPVRWWLSFHIVTGLVGPFLVLMHTGLQFRGLAGVTALLTLIVVISGFVGRYFYTALQSGIHARMTTHNQLEAQAETVQQTINQMQTDKATRIQRIQKRVAEKYGRDSWWQRWRYKRNLQKALLKSEKEEAGKEAELEAIRRQQQKLNQQAERLGQTRHWFQLWHTVHIPLGLTLFTAVGIHILVTLIFRVGLFK